MARKTAGEGKNVGKDVRLSVVIPPDAHEKLRALVTKRRTTANEFVAGLIVKAVEGVRLAHVPDDPADGSSRAASA